jgi:hypothetical protein
VPCKTSKWRIFCKTSANRIFAIGPDADQVEGLPGGFYESYVSAASALQYGTDYGTELTHQNFYDRIEAFAQPHRRCHRLALVKARTAGPFRLSLHSGAKPRTREPPDLLGRNG